MGLQELVARTLAREVHDWLAAHDLRFDWVSGETFHYASIRNELRPFIQAVAERGVILVGPERLSHLDGRVFPVRSHVVTPELNCHRACDRVIAETRRALDIHGVGPVVSISASMSANVIVHRLHASHPHATVMDMGSVWEPYVGHANRSYHAAVIARERAS